MGTIIVLYGLLMFTVLVTKTEKSKKNYYFVKNNKKTPQ